MGYLTRLLAAESGPPGPLDDVWYQATMGAGTQSGMRISPEIALEVSAVFACVKVIAETIATLPLIVYERVSDREKQRAYGTSEYQLLHNAPNSWQTPYDFKENLTAWAALHGTGVAIKIFNPDGSVKELDPIHPNRVRIEKVTTTRQIRYNIQQPDGVWKPYVQGEILHIRGFSIDGITGIPLSVAAREAIALARAMESFGARYFANDTTVGLVLEHPGKLSDEALKHLQEGMRGFTGPNQWKAKVLEEGMKLNRIQASARDAQLTDARLHQVIEICRYFRMPPHKIAHMLQATFSNIEHQAIEFSTDTIQPWAVRWEEALTRDVILDDEKYFAEFLMTALLRGDATARSQYYRERFHIGTLSRNEIRALENENPIEGGDTFYVNAAVIPLDKDGRPIPTPRVTEPGVVTPDTPANSPPDSADQTDSSALAFGALSAWVADASDRIAKAEAREIEKRVAKQTEDAPRFTAWVRDWYGTHRRFVVKTLQPIAEAYEQSAGYAVDVERIASLVIESGMRAVADNGLPFDAAAFCAARYVSIGASVRSELLALDSLPEMAHA